MSRQTAEPERFWEPLLQFVEEGRVVPVIGQELLRIATEDGPTTLQDLLASRLERHLGLSVSERPGARSLNAVVCNFLARGGDLEDVYPALKAVMPKRGELEIPEPLRMLAAIRPFDLFVTTAFDSFLEDAIDEVRHGGVARTRSFAFSPVSAEDIPRRYERSEAAIVYHLFGRLSAVPDYAVTEEDALEFVHALQSETRKPQLLFDEITRKHLLLLGSSFDDWLARFFIRIGKRERLWMARGKTDIVADAKHPAGAGLAVFLQHFSARTKVFQGGDAVEFVSQLHARWAERSPQRMNVPRLEAPTQSELPRMSFGSVFISYASEDLDVVEPIRAALDQAGVDVWLDRSRLEGGDAYESVICRNIESSSLFLAVISRNCLTPQRRFFRVEWNHADRIARRASPTQRFVVPIFVDDTPETDPALPERFRSLHGLRLPDGAPTPEFVDTVRRCYREFQKALASGQ